MVNNKKRMVNNKKRMTIKDYLALPFIIGSTFIVMRLPMPIKVIVLLSLLFVFVWYFVKVRKKITKEVISGSKIYFLFLAAVSSIDVILTFYLINSDSTLLEFEQNLLITYLYTSIGNLALPIILAVNMAVITLAVLSMYIHNKRTVKFATIIIGGVMIFAIISNLFYYLLIKAKI